MVDIGLTTLVAHTLNKSLPKARIIRELDENIQKYKSADITDRDVYLLSVRIANNQVKNIEDLNSLAVSDIAEFNYRVKEEARKQAEIEAEQQKQLNNLFSELSKAIQSVSKQSEAMSIEKKASDEQVYTLKNQLYKSEIDKNTLSKQIDKKDEKINFQKKVIVGLIVLIVAILTVILFVFLPIKQYIKVIAASIGSLGGVWGFISMIINLVKLRR